MKTFLLAAALLIAPAIFADAAGTPRAPAAYDLDADQWAQQRSGGALLRLQPVHDAVAEWLAHPDAHILIRHAAGDAGALWAGELSDWLVSLGVPGDHIERSASADQPDDAVTLLVRR